MTKEHGEFRELYRAVLALSNEEECAAFFEDLCTAQEMKTISQRLLVAKLLLNQHVYTEIEELTGASSATISRVNRSLQYGTGGYEEILKRLDEKDE